MEKLEIEQSLKKTTNSEVVKIKISEIPSTSEASYLRKIKPRAIIFKANDKDFCKLTDSLNYNFLKLK